MLGKQAIQSYADFEQLVGGIETLFGARGAKTVEEYAELMGKSVNEVQSEFNMLMEAQTKAMNDANNAYKDAGMSANEYMETVSAFAASLKQSTENELEAAEAANLAVIDMSDNASKMGTSMESIQNAYQGFAKQNYTMLDNLKLGYGGTKEEMQRLLADATALSGVEYDISKLKDVYAAIHVIQDELGITGTTAKEASATISGSVSAMTSAWSNLVVGIADDNADFEQLIDNFVDSAVIVMENLVPRVEIALNGVGALVEELLPIIVARIPELVDTVLPDLLNSGVNMLLIICQGIIDTLPVLGETAFELIEKLLTSITDNSESVFLSGSELLFDFIWGITDKIPDLMSMMVDTILALALAITEPNVLANVITAGIELIVALVSGLIDAIPELLEAVPTIIARLVAGLVASSPQLLSAAVSIMLKLANGLLDSIWILLSLPAQIFEDFIDAFDKVKWSEIGVNMLKGLWRGIQNGWSWLADQVGNLANDLFGAACDALDINSPSKKFEWIGDMCIAGLDEPIEDYNPYDTLQNSMKANTAGLQATFTRTALATAGGSTLDYAMMGDELKGALKGAGVYLNGEKVGELITPTVNNELADYTDRRI